MALIKRPPRCIDVRTHGGHNKMAHAYKSAAFFPAAHYAEIKRVKRGTCTCKFSISQYKSSGGCVSSSFAKKPAEMSRRMARGSDTSIINWIRRTNRKLSRGVYLGGACAYFGECVDGFNVRRRRL